MLKSLQNISFRNLWLSQAFSNIGDALYYTAFLFFAKHQTGSSVIVGYVGAAETLPYLLFGAVAGVAADRLNRKWILAISDLARAAVLALVGALFLRAGKMPVWALLSVPFALSTASSFFMPARAAGIPMIVAEDELQAANALMSVTQSVMPMVGLALGGTIMGILYAISARLFFVTTVWSNGFTFLVSAFFLIRLPRMVPAGDPKARTHMMREFAEGIGYVRKRHDLALVTVLLTLFRIMVAPFMVFYVAANDAWFGGKPQTLAWLDLVFFIGIALGSIAAGKVKVVKPLLWFLSELTVVGICCGAMAWSRQIPLMMFWNFIAGISVPLGDVPFATYVQRTVSERFQGRVNAVVNMIAYGAMPIGAALGGIALGKFGLVACFIGMGIGMTAAGATGFLDPVSWRSTFTIGDSNATASM